MKKKTKSGEYYTDVYQTSFNVLVFDGDGDKHWVRARIEVPKSEARFYKGIYKLHRNGHISELARLSAELHCFQKGYKTVA